MSITRHVNLRSFRQKARHNKKRFKKFLTKLEKNPVRKLDIITAEVEKQVWPEIDCLSCSNCCRQMTPTYTEKDINRIAASLDMTTEAFKKKWLKKDREGDWLNKSTPCQFLNLQTNMCSIYEVRPVDCAGFPHLPKRKMVDYMHIHKQNLEYCPATYKMVEKMMERLQ